ncbi:MAG: hypothetical protein E7566_03035 [Ruminococcaceae bacterium]|nr:hypothetical protein [Oscillospiraceae bacterium]
MNKKLKSILNIALDVLIVLFLVFAAVTLVISLSQKAEEPGGEPSHLFGTSIRSVQSESMEPYNEDGTKYESDNAFYKGDIIFCKLTDDNDSFKIGDAVMFWMPLDAHNQQCSNQIYTTKVLVTHEIVRTEVKEDGTILYYTQGLNRKTNFEEDLLAKTADEFVAKYNGKRIGGVGKAIDFVQSGLGFFLCIVLPILIFVIIQTIRVIRNFIAYKAQKAATAVASGELTDEQKKLIAEEYLKQLNTSDSKATPSTDEAPADEAISVEEETPAE